MDGQKRLKAAKVLCVGTGGLPAATGSPQPPSPIATRTTPGSARRTRRVRGGRMSSPGYGRAAEPFVAWAEAHGAIARDGLGMLVEQAAEAVRFWRDVEPETTPVLRALRERLAST